MGIDQGHSGPERGGNLAEFHAGEVAEDSS